GREQNTNRRLRGDGGAESGEYPGLQRQAARRSGARSRGDHRGCGITQSAVETAARQGGAQRSAWQAGDAEKGFRRVGEDDGGGGFPGVVSPAPPSRRRTNTVCI